MATGNAIQFSFGIDLANLKNGAARSQGIVGSAMAGISKSSLVAFAGIAGAANAAFGKMISAAQNASGKVGDVFNAGLEINTLSKQTGIAAGRLYQMGGALKSVNVEAGKLAPAINRMQKLIVAPTPTASAAFDQLKINLSDLAKRPTDQQFTTIATAIGAVVDPAMRAADAMAIFGKSGAELLPLFENSGAIAGMSGALSEKARVFGESSAQFAAAAQNIRRAGNMFQGFYVGLASGVAVTVAKLFGAFSTLDFVGIGRKVGAALGYVAEMILATFRSPGRLIGPLVSAFQSFAVVAGNVLIGAFNVGLDFLRTGLADTFQGLGHVIMGALTMAFDPAIARFQAGMESVIQSLPSALTGVTYLDPKEDARLQGKVDLSREYVKHPEKQSVIERGMNLATGNTPESLLKQSEKALADYRATGVRKRSREELEKEYQGKGARLQVGNEEMSGAAVYARGLGEMRAGWKAGAAAVGNYKYVDYLGAGKGLAGITANFGGVLAGSQKASAAYQGEQPAPPPAEVHARVLWMRTNDTSDYGKKWDAYRQNQTRQAHTVGGNTMLDDHPMMNKAWTGAREAMTNLSAAPFRNATGLQTGGLDGGAYGGAHGYARQGRAARENERDEEAKRLAAKDKSGEETRQYQTDSLKALGNIVTAAQETSDALD